MSMASIVRALGGELYEGGRRANIPAPGRNAQDRSISLQLSRGRVVVHCVDDSDWRTVLHDLRTRGLIDGRERPIGDTITSC